MKLRLLFVALALLLCLTALAPARSATKTNHGSTRIQEQPRANARPSLSTVHYQLSIASPTDYRAKRTDDTETVYTIFYVIPGKEAEFAKVLAQAWPAYHRFKMVLNRPNLIFRGQDEAGRPYFMQILTWKDHEAPDNAPPEVQAIWDQMNALCEKRDGHRRIEFFEIKPVDPKTLGK